MKKLNRSRCIIYIAAVLFLTVFMSTSATIYHAIKIEKINPRIAALENKIDRINNSITVGITMTDNIYLDFLRDETEAYRVFIEQQEQHLLWIVGGIGAVSMTLLAFFGWKSKEDITSLIDTQYKSEINTQFDRLLKDAIKNDTSIEFLREQAKLTKEMHDKRILFIGKSNDSEVEKMYDWFSNHNVCHTNYRIDYPNKTTENILSEVSTFNVIVYEVSNNTADANSSIPRFREIADICKNYKKECILFTGTIWLNQSEKEALDPLLVTTVNFLSKLRESLFMLLANSSLEDKDKHANI